MTAEAPASASISAARSPVWAPAGSGWQSWPPTGNGPPAKKRASSVAGGQISTSKAGMGQGGEVVDHGGEGCEAVHLPVAGNELAAGHLRSSLFPAVR